MNKVQDRKKVQNQPRNGRSLEDRYRGLFENVPVGLYITTPDGTIRDANPALVEMLGYPNRESLLGMSASDLYVNPRDRDRELRLLDDSLIVARYETQLARLDGSLIWVRDTCRAVRDASGAIVSYEGSLLDITVERKAQDELTHMAQHDPLTGLFNRRMLRSLVDSEFERARRYEHPIGVLMIDVNRFKEINDRHGHATGDRVLVAVAGVLRETLRESDVPVRYGGDEFLVLLIETNGETDIVRRRIRQELSRRSKADLDLPVTLAIGAAHWLSKSGESIESVLLRADLEMYADKRRSS